MTKRIIVLDPSTSHLAYVYIDLTDKEAIVQRVGMLWTKESWGMGQKLDYMHNALDALIEEDLAEYHTEAYFVHFGRPSGISAIPTINNMFRMLIWRKTGKELLNEISPTSWRKTLGIKPEVINGKKDFKVPTKKKVESLVGNMPETIISNITGKLRALPHDITDALAISLAIAKEKGYNTFSMSRNAFDNTEIKERLDNI